ncbi:hypothetical protein BKM16_26925 [Pseudomonas amygdali pv. morsprunorum]|nr:hypothetical protein BKM22_27100 [Pseudomonas amygdali pv. morsprunorum]POD37478.1 hypothetical protein BKM16_26925 [Pseudomonas amygdali pv. morsprunorum]POD39095.1 hypothetical protein BKM02_27045 [Pseudomonas amygdali pv. morsprunorum]
MAVIVLRCVMENNIEKYISWHISETELGRCDLRLLLRSEEKLILTLSTSSAVEREVVLSFELKDIVGFKLSNDSYTWRSDNVRVTPPNSSLFKVECSNYIEWFKAETYNAGDLRGVIHFSLLLGEESVDIVSFNEPSVLFLK